MRLVKDIIARIYFAGVVFCAAVELIFKFLFTCLVLAVLVSSARAQAPEVPSTLQFSENPPLYSALLEPARPADPQIIVEMPQIILRFDHESGRSNVVEVQARVALELLPVGHPAPLSKDAVMLCRPYNLEKHLMMRCGLDHYVVTGFSFQESKQ